MNYILSFYFILALIIGIINGFAKMSGVRKNPELGCEPSKNIFTFLFSDKY